MCTDGQRVVAKGSLATTTRCVDYAVKIRVNAQQTGIDTNVKHSMVRQANPF